MEQKSVTPDKVENVLELSTSTGRFDLSSSSAYNYIMPKAIGSLAVGSVVGAAVGHFVGDKLAIYLYSGGFASAAFGASFHGGSYLLECARKENDFLNFAASGAIHGFVLSVPTHGWRRGSIVSLGGGVLGAAYFFASNWIYNNTRTAWINSRRRVLELSTEKKVVPHRPAFPRGNLPPLENNSEAAEKLRNRVASFFGGISKDDDN